MPYNGPMPDFTMGPYDPSQDPEFGPLGGGRNSAPAPSPQGGARPMPYTPGSGTARPMPYTPGSGTARPMPMPMPQGRPPFSGPGAQDRLPPPPAGVQRGPDGMPRRPSPFGPNMDRMPPSGNPNGPNMDNMPTSMMDEEKRRALIQAILSRQFGG